MRRFTVLFRFTKPGEKKPGPVQRYVLFANSMEESLELLRRQATYPNLEIISVTET